MVWKCIFIFNYFIHLAPNINNIILCHTLCQEGGVCLCLEYVLNFTVCLCFDFHCLTFNFDFETFDFKTLYVLSTCMFVLCALILQPNTNRLSEWLTVVYDATGHSTPKGYPWQHHSGEKIQRAESEKGHHQQTMGHQCTSQSTAGPELCSGCRWVTEMHCEEKHLGGEIMIVNCWNTSDLPPSTVIL